MSNGIIGDVIARAAEVLCESTGIGCSQPLEPIDSTGPSPSPDPHWPGEIEAILERIRLLRNNRTPEMWLEVAHDIENLGLRTRALEMYQRLPEVVMPTHPNSRAL